jgi:hypothetical protein
VAVRLSEGESNLLRPLAAWCAPCVLLLAAGSSAATPVKPTAAAAVLIDRGAAQYDAGEYAKAAASLRAAYELVPEPRLLFNIARAYEKAGDTEQAFEFYERYLDATGTEAELRHRARDSLKHLTAPPVETALPPAPPPTVVPTPTAPDAPAAPVQLPLQPASPPAPTEPPPMPAAALAATPEPPARSSSRTVGWVLMSAGAVAAGTGAGFGVWALNTAQAERASLDPVQKPALRSSAQTRATVADVGVGAGVALAAAGAWLWLRRPATSGPTVGLGPGGAIVRWTFDFRTLGASER